MHGGQVIHFLSHPCIGKNEVAETVSKVIERHTLTLRILTNLLITQKLIAFDEYKLDILKEDIIVHQKQ